MSLKVTVIRGMHVLISSLSISFTFSQRDTFLFNMMSIRVIKVTRDFLIAFSFLMIIYFRFRFASKPWSTF